MHPKIAERRQKIQDEKVAKVIKQAREETQKALSEIEGLDDIWEITFSPEFLLPSPDADSVDGSEDEDY